MDGWQFQSLLPNLNEDILQYFFRQESRLGVQKSNLVNPVFMANEQLFKCPFIAFSYELKIQSSFWSMVGMDMPRQIRAVICG